MRYAFIDSIMREGKPETRRIIHDSNLLTASVV